MRALISCTFVDVHYMVVLLTLRMLRCDREGFPMALCPDHCSRRAARVCAAAGAAGGGGAGGSSSMSTVDITSTRGNLKRLEPEPYAILRYIQSHAEVDNATAGCAGCLGDQPAHNESTSFGAASGPIVAYRSC